MGSANFISDVTLQDPPLLDVGDVNGDDIPDLVFVDFGDVLTVRLGDGSGGFEAAMTFDPGRTLHGLAVGDVNGDGVSDVIYAQETGVPFGEDRQRIVDTTVFARLGAAGDDMAVLNGVPESVRTVIGITLDLIPLNFALDTGDINGNGAEEVLVASIQQPNLSRVLVLERAGSSYSVLTERNELPVLDEILFHSGPQAQRRITVGRGDGTFAFSFEAQSAALVDAVDLTPLLPSGEAVLRDVNNDGNPDLFVTRSSTLESRLQGLRAVIAQDGAEPYLSALLPEGNRAIVASDVDRDGLPDVLAIDAVRQSLHSLAQRRSSSADNRADHGLPSVGLPIPIGTPGSLFDEVTDAACFGDFN
ncbi:MAG: VCBS repeat-containing protein, partial [Myxococcota bacterium]